MYKLVCIVNYYHNENDYISTAGVFKTHVIEFLCNHCICHDD